MRAEGLEGVSFVFNHTHIAKNRHYYFPRPNTAPYSALLTTAVSWIEIAKEGMKGMEAGLRKAANNIPYRGGGKNVAIRDSVISGKGFAKTKIQDLLASLWHSLSEVLHKGISLWILLV